MTSLQFARQSQAGHEPEVRAPRTGRRLALVRNRLGDDVAGGAEMVIGGHASQYRAHRHGGVPVLGDVGLRRDRARAHNPPCLNDEPETERMLTQWDRRALEEAERSLMALARFQLASLGVPDDAGPARRVAVAGLRGEAAGG